MAIKASLLNKTVVIERRATTFDASGDSTGARTEIEAAVSMRIVNNEPFGASVGAKAETIVSSSHKGLTDGGHGGQEGDFVIDGADEFVIAFIDKKPGGQISTDKIYHWEIFMNATTLERA